MPLFTEDPGSLMLLRVQLGLVAIILSFPLVAFSTTFSLNKMEFLERLRAYLCNLVSPKGNSAFDKILSLKAHERARLGRPLKQVKYRKKANLVELCAVSIWM